MPEHITIRLTQQEAEGLLLAIENFTMDDPHRAAERVARKAVAAMQEAGWGSATAAARQAKGD